MAFLKTVGCECAECGPDACTEGDCLCNLSLDTSGGDAGYDETFDATADFASDRDIYVTFATFTIKDRLIIKANGTEIYNSGCISGTVTPTITVPGGTTSIQVIVEPNCEGTTGTAWTLDITCE